MKAPWKILLLLLCTLGGMAPGFSRNYSQDIAALPPNVSLDGALTTDAVQVIPLPSKIAVTGGTFSITPATTVVFDGASAAEPASYLAEQFRTSGRPDLKIVDSRTSKVPAKGYILLSARTGTADSGAEGYKLTVSPESIQIRANTSAGLFYGVQTLRQLLPISALSSPGSAAEEIVVPCVKIEDKPRFAWRGCLLDVSRHFFTKDELKRYFDGLALHKMNMCQLHLTDDDGWRVEIKKYPLLTQQGAWRDSIGFGLDPKLSTAYRADGKYGGFYSQDDMRELVKYAESRHITLVPEIEMPGHSGAALTAYPDMRCIGAKDSNVYCLSNEGTYSFLQDILTEVFDLFPSKYIHIGGDEVGGHEWMNCEKCQAKMKELGFTSPHQLENYMIGRMGKFINSKDRVLVGWSEIKEGGGVPPRAVLMDWIGGAVDAANSGHDVVMAPTTACYFDYYQSIDPKKEAPAMPNTFLPLQYVYNFEPIPGDVSETRAKNIVGTEGCVWTEFIPSLSQAEYMTYPRMCALSEVSWSPKESRDWNYFNKRLQTHSHRLDVLGINYRHASVDGGEPKDSPRQQ